MSPDINPELENSAESPLEQSLMTRTGEILNVLREYRDVIAMHIVTAAQNSKRMLIVGGIVIPLATAAILLSHATGSLLPKTADEYVLTGEASQVVDSLGHSYNVRPGLERALACKDENVLHFGRRFSDKLDFYNRNLQTGTQTDLFKDVEVQQNLDPQLDNLGNIYVEDPQGWLNILRPGTNSPERIYGFETWSSGWLVSPDGKTLAYQPTPSSVEGKLKLIDLTTGKPISSTNETGYPMVWTADGKALAVSRYNPSGAVTELVEYTIGDYGRTYSFDTGKYTYKKVVDVGGYFGFLELNAHSTQPGVPTELVFSNPNQPGWEMRTGFTGYSDISTDGAGNVYLEQEDSSGVNIWKFNPFEGNTLSRVYHGITPMYQFVVCKN
jgi:hypothetical protein